MGLLLLLPPGWASSPAAPLPEPVMKAEPMLRLLGSGTLHWFGLHVYTAALYVDGAAYASSGAAVLTITYHRRIKSARLLATTLKEWERMKTGSIDQRREWIKLLTGLWPDVKPGDRLTAFHTKQGDTRFFLGGQPLGKVADPAFGPAFLAIWLGPDARYPEVRAALLGETTTREPPLTWWGSPRGKPGGMPCSGVTPWRYPSMARPITCSSTTGCF
jgi:hypothetical protein